MDKNKKLLYFNFNHKNYDGELMAHYIKEDLIKCEIKNNTNINIYNFKSYQYINTKRILNYSKFTSSISHLLAEMIKYQKREMNICIIVSTRNKINNKMKKGNFVKFAHYTVNPSDNILSICFKHYTAVKKIQQYQYFTNNTTLYDFACLFNNVDYVFNNWKNLSSINTKNNGLLIRQPIDKIEKIDIYNFKYIKNRVFIILDFLNDKYIISKIIHI